MTFLMDSRNYFLFYPTPMLYNSMSNKFMYKKVPA